MKIPQTQVKNKSITDYMKRSDTRLIQDSRK